MLLLIHEFHLRQGLAYRLKDSQRSVLLSIDSKIGDDSTSISSFINSLRNNYNHELA